MQEHYHHERSQKIASDECPLCIESPTKTFTYWLLLPNKYPYDAVATKHDLLLSRRHVATYEELNQAEQDKLRTLKQGILNTDYDYILEAMPKNKSIPGHFHLHLIQAKTI